jgi:hypothetical protein
MKLKRFLYLGYYFKNLDWKKFRSFFNHVRETKKISSFALFTDIIGSSLRYNISLLEYFQFGFYEMGAEERRTYAGTGCMYEYQLIMNPKSSRGCLDNKVEFFENYGAFIHHITAGIESLKRDEKLQETLLRNPSGKIVLKYSRGQCGWQVRIFDADFFRDKDLVAFMEKEGFDLAEEFLVQHSALMALSPSAVNTVRVITQLNSRNEVEILGARLRISENSPVDNMAAGNFAAPIDIETGVVNGPGVYSDITRKDVSVHPITGIPVVGFQVPYWSEILDMMQKAARQVPENRSIGWDIAVTEKGPELIEGNHDWCKLVWQLPVKKGLKPVLDRHLSEHFKEF